MMLNREGVFHVYPIEIGVDETGANNLATCIVRYQIFQEKIDGVFEEIAAEEITTWYYLEKKDGSINDFTISALKAAFGWDGRDAFWLQDTELSDHPVQITCAFETYNGQERLKVLWTNPFGSESGGGVTKAADSVRKAIGNRLGAKLRAAAGGTPANAKSPTKAAPTSPTKRNSPGAAPDTTPENDTPDATLEEAWAAFAAACPEKWSQEDCEKEWFRILELMFAKPAGAMTPADWGRMKADGPREIIPI